MRAIEVVLTNEDKGYQFARFVERLDNTYMGENASSGDIFRAMREEYGRCTGKVYIDEPNDPAKPCGWFFVSRQRYEDTGEPYLRGAWVTVGEYHPAIPEHVEV